MDSTEEPISHRVTNNIVKIHQRTAADRLNPQQKKHQPMKKKIPTKSMKEKQASFFERRVASRP